MSKSSNDENYIMSRNLAKLTLLYQIINPNCTKLSGRNVFQIFIMALIIFTMICMCICLFGLYYWANDTTQFILQLVILSNFSFGCFKVFTIIRHSEDIWRCKEVTRIDFVSTDVQSVDYLKTCRDIASTFTCWFAVINFSILFVWALVPILMKGKYVDVKNRDNTYSNYLFSPFNMFFLVSNDTYNNWHIVFHIIEMLNGMCFVQFMIVFDTFMVSFCVAITAQLKVIATAYKDLGPKHTKVYFNGKYATLVSHDNLIKF